MSTFVLNIQDCGEICNQVSKLPFNLSSFHGPRLVRLAVLLTPTRAGMREEDIDSGDDSDYWRY